uniref:Alanine dehydrogenase/pyridine nucleotide transhydrogenase N-terminal domain-containing protein n=1 Tax=uncultured Muribaculaceae bacterium TaxID=2301481 RepID=A0A6G8F3S6_9BACT|nr:hypothetical protein Muribac1_0920 [uncultured Muribaculaceae bacterium]
MTEKEKSTIELEPQPQSRKETDHEKSLRIGLVGNYEDTEETRFLLTPEGCGLLTSSGITVLMETGAATDISFPDSSYSEFGAKIVSREEALKADVVLSYLPLRVNDIQKMNNGATLFTMMDQSMFEKNVVEALLEKGITAGCLDNMYSFNDEPVFANIVDEIDGRASVIYAQEFLSYVGGGKGVLLAGVAGLNPCEVLVIGDGTAAYSAAKAAMAAGAYVTLMNNDISALQVAKQCCGDSLNTVAIHPRVLFNKVKSADVILIAECTRPFEFPKNLSVAIKDSVYVLNFSETKPSLSVPRTVAMALSNVLVNFFSEMLIKGGVESMLASTSGVQAGIVCYRGKLVDKLVASYLGMTCVDIKVMLAATN